MSIDYDAFLALSIQSPTRRPQQPAHQARIVQRSRRSEEHQISTPGGETKGDTRCRCPGPPRPASRRCPGPPRHAVCVAGRLPCRLEDQAAYGGPIGILRVQPCRPIPPTPPEGQSEANRHVLHRPSRTASSVLPAPPQTPVKCQQSQYDGEHEWTASRRPRHRARHHVGS